MENEIGENFLLYSTTHEIWDAVKELYSSKENTSKIFKIETNLHDLRQGDLVVIQYYNIPLRHWQQLDMFEEHHWNCPDDVKNSEKLLRKGYSNS